jgi:hypothetical protein
VDENNEIVGFNPTFIKEWIAIPTNVYDKEWGCLITHSIYHKDSFDETIKIHESKYYLSFNGNILVKRENELPFWCNAKGDYLKNASSWDVENVTTRVEIPLTIHSLRLLSAINNLKAEEWYHVASIRTCDDYYKVDYALYTTTHLFISTLGRKAQLDTTSTSADSSFDELSAEFTIQNCEGVQLQDVVNKFEVYTAREDAPVFLVDCCTIVEDCYTIVEDYCATYHKINSEEDTSFSLSDDEILDIIKQHQDYDAFSKYLSPKPRNSRGRRTAL